MTAYMELKQIVDHHDREASSASSETLALFHRKAAITIRHVMAMMPMDGNLPRQHYAETPSAPQSS